MPVRQVNAMTYREAYNFGKKLLLAAGIDDYDNDSSLLVQHVIESPNWFGLDHSTELTKAQEELFLQLLSQRERRVPLQHIIGYMYFYGYKFHTREGVLIPRYDTENLVERALKAAPDRNIRFLDLCTGSGCIGISFWRRRRREGRVDHGLLTDISPEALSLAKENIDLQIAFDDGLGEITDELGTHLEVMESDLFDALEGQKFDLILSNPPYIPVSEMEGLMPEVRDHDPRIALTDEGDGLSFYRRIAAEAKTYLKPDGYLVLEIGYDQGEAVPEIMKDAGFERVNVYKDLAGMDRVVVVHR